MSGHSKWATNKRRKEAVDAKRGAIFTKLGNALTVAARQGSGDIESNFQLRLAVDRAKAANMPKDNIERAIKKGSGENQDGNHLEEAVYEMFGPQNSAFIIEVITDNKNRTLSELKIVANKNGGNLGSTNSALWMFERLGLIIINAITENADEWELKIIDAGAQDIAKNESEWEIYTEAGQLQAVTTQLKKLDLNINESSLTYKAKEDLMIESGETQNKIEKLYSALDDLDDVSSVNTNANW